MPHRRSITSDIATDERLAEIAQEESSTALLWPWFLLLFDDWGRTEANAMKVKLTMFPAFPFDADTIRNAFETFQWAGLLHIYEADGKRYAAVRPMTWLEYQRYLKGSKSAGVRSKIPAPDDAPWSKEEDREFFRALLKPGLRANLQKSAETAESLQILQKSEKSVPSPSPSPSPIEPKTIVHEDKGRAGRTAYEVKIKAAFDEYFWPYYPRRVAKAAALKAFKKTFPLGQGDAEKQERWKNLSYHLGALRTEFADRSKEDLKFCPYPASWLNATDFDSSPEDDSVQQVERWEEVPRDE